MTPNFLMLPWRDLLMTNRHIVTKVSPLRNAVAIRGP